MNQSLRKRFQNKDLINLKVIKISQYKQGGDLKMVDNQSILIKKYISFDSARDGIKAVGDAYSPYKHISDESLQPGLLKSGDPNPILSIEEDNNIIKLEIINNKYPKEHFKLVCSFITYLMALNNYSLNESQILCLNNFINFIRKENFLIKKNQDRFKNLHLFYLILTQNLQFSKKDICQILRDSEFQEFISQIIIKYYKYYDQSKKIKDFLDFFETVFLFKINRLSEEDVLNAYNQKYANYDILFSKKFRLNPDKYYIKIIKNANKPYLSIIQELALYDNIFIENKFIVLNHIRQYDTSIQYSCPLAGMFISILHIIVVLSQTDQTKKKLLTQILDWLEAQKVKLLEKMSQPSLVNQMIEKYNLKDRCSYLSDLKQELKYTSETNINNINDLLFKNPKCAIFPFLFYYIDEYKAQLKDFYSSSDMKKWKKLFSFLLIQLGIEDPIKALQDQDSSEYNLFVIQQPVIKIFFLNAYIPILQYSFDNGVFPRNGQYSNVSIQQSQMNQSSMNNNNLTNSNLWNKDISTNYHQNFVQPPQRPLNLLCVKCKVQATDIFISNLSWCTCCLDEYILKNI